MLIWRSLSPQILASALTWLGNRQSPALLPRRARRHAVPDTPPLAAPPLRQHRHAPLVRTNT